MLFRSVRQSQNLQSIHLRNYFVDREAIDQWFSDYILRLKSENSDDDTRQIEMNLVNPKYILRNHLAQIAIEKAIQHDFSEIKRLHELLSKPYDEQVEFEAYAMPPPPDLERVEVSCSS